VVYIYIDIHISLWPLWAKYFTQSTRLDGTVAQWALTRGGAQGSILCHDRSAMIWWYFMVLSQFFHGNMILTDWKYDMKWYHNDFNDINWLEMICYRFFSWFEWLAKNGSLIRKMIIDSTRCWFWTVLTDWLRSRIMEAVSAAKGVLQGGKSNGSGSKIGALPAKSSKNR